jgi:ssDNA-binding Zn-finger/Zn-ribbon topoisomerase 1
MDYVILILCGVMGLALLLGVIGFISKRGRIEKSQECWQCGFDLSACAARIDFRGDRRCPKCGELIEADMPGKIE